LEKLVADLSSQNELLISLIKELKLQNAEFNSLIQSLKLENDLLLQKIDLIKSTANTGTTVIAQQTDPFFIKTVIIVTAAGAALLGAYFLTSFVAAKVANTSVGLLFYGLDNQLKILGNKIGLFNTNDHQYAYTFMDSVNRRYVVDLSSNSKELYTIKIETQGHLVDIGSYISELLQMCAQYQSQAATATVDLVTNTVLRNDLSSVAVQTTNAIGSNAPNIENAVAVADMLSRSSIF
jgi:hypothetical protein